MLMVWPKGGQGNSTCSNPGTGAPKIYFPGQSADGGSTDEAFRAGTSSQQYEKRKTTIDAILSGSQITPN